MLLHLFKLIIGLIVFVSSLSNMSPDNVIVKSVGMTAGMLLILI